MDAADSEFFVGLNIELEHKEHDKALFVLAQFLS